MLWDMEQTQWERQCRLAKAYYHEHGDLDISPSYETPVGIKLGRWLQRMRRDYKKGVLEQGRAERLEAIGIVWDPLDSRWEANRAAAKRYYEEHGDLRIPSDHVTPKGSNLGQWIARLRIMYKQGKLSGEQIRRLESIGMVWDPGMEQWERSYKAASAYYREHGHLRVPAGYVNADGFRLGEWARRTRKLYKAGKLSREQIQRLESIGMIWDQPKQEKKSVRTEQRYSPASGQSI